MIAFGLGSIGIGQAQSQIQFRSRMPIGAVGLGVVALGWGDLLNSSAGGNGVSIIWLHLARHRGRR